MPKEIKLKIILRDPVDGIVYGLQKGKGAGYETVQAQMGSGQDLGFDFFVDVKQTAGKASSVSGPFVQGTAGNRFIYFGIGSYAGQKEAEWNGRIKVPLEDATFLSGELNDADAAWSCTVPGRDKEGKPAFATVRDFEGWTMSGK